MLVAEARREGIARDARGLPKALRFSNPVPVFALSYYHNITCDRLVGRNSPETAREEIARPTDFQTPFSSIWFFFSIGASELTPRRPLSRAHLK